MMNQIEHISDQLELFANEVAHIIKNVQSAHDLTFDEAARVVEIATRDMQCDVLHHMQASVDTLADAVHSLKDEY